MSEQEQRPSRFRWSAGGWFGGQIGATAWLALLGGLYLFRDPAVAWLVLLCFALPNGVGIWLWRRRQRLPPFSALMVLSAISGLAALAAIAIMDAYGHLHEIEPRLPARAMYWVLLVYPAVMLQFWIMEWASRRR